MKLSTLLLLAGAAVLTALPHSPTVAASHHNHKEKKKESSDTKLRSPFQVVDLPGLDSKDVAFDHFAGQIHLPTDTNEKLFYWYAESQSDPANDPIVLWLNGGPGCSSINGFFTENGPFVVQPDLTVEINPYGWNRKANIVWVDSPSGVGFSAPLQDASYYNDDITSDRLHTFLRLFFDQYPELQNRDFYITGESYAGIYIPYLVDRLVENPIEGVNLKGFAIGNPLTDVEIDGNAYMDYYFSHALISRQNYHKMLEYCADEIAQCMFVSTNCTDICQQAVNEAHVAADVDDFNHYYIYGDVCMIKNSQRSALHVHHHPVKNLRITHRGEVGPCADTYTDTYLNLPAVQIALHVEGAPVEWTDCNHFISRNFPKCLSALPKYRNILGRGLKALIYSGDADSVVNFIGTERWITDDGLNLNETRGWRAWIGPDKQIAGYVQEYDGLTFKTVKGAGHMVPAVRPLHGLNLFECFIYGDEVCATFKYPFDPFEIEAGDSDDEYEVESGTEDSSDAAAEKEEKLDEHEDKEVLSLARIALSVTQNSSSTSFYYVGGIVVALMCGIYAHKAVRQARRRRQYTQYPNEERLPLASST